MASTIVALPIPHDKVSAVRAFVAELLGPRRAEIEASWQNKGFTREAAWLQPTADGALVLVWFEADDLARAFLELGTSETPFDRWYRQTVLDIYGVDLTASRPPNELLADWQAQ
jgi:hypothetical protein